VLPGEQAPEQAPSQALPASSWKSMPTVALPLRRNTRWTSATTPTEIMTETGSPTQLGTDVLVTAPHPDEKAMAEKTSTPSGSWLRSKLASWPLVTSKFRVTVRAPLTVTCTHPTSAGTCMSATDARPSDSSPAELDGDEQATSEEIASALATKLRMGNASVSLGNGLRSPRQCRVLEKRELSNVLSPEADGTRIRFAGRTCDEWAEFRSRAWPIYRLELFKPW
jgi:hypothetical protein